MGNAQSSFNVAIGTNALNCVNTGHNNVAVGYNAMARTGDVGGNNVAIGYNVTTVGYNNCVVVGYGAGSTINSHGQLSIGGTGMSGIFTTLSAALTGTTQVWLSVWFANKRCYFPVMKDP
jgi:hypothetical protein